MFNQQSSYHNICTQNSFSEYQNEEKTVILFSHFSLSNNPQNAFPGVQKDSFLNFFHSGPTMVVPRGVTAACYLKNAPTQKIGQIRHCYEQENCRCALRDIWI